MMIRAWDVVRGEWVWFGAWAAVGTAAALGAVSLGPIAFVPAIVAAILLAVRPNSRRSAFGLLSGVGILLLAVAWVHREGPGTTCWHTATGSGCTEHLNPLPWLIVGVMFLLAGFLGQLKLMR